MLEAIDLDQLPLEQIPGLIEAPIETSQDKPKMLIRESNNKSGN